jgi:hypothetical protein
VPTDSGPQRHDKQGRRRVGAECPDVFDVSGEQCAKLGRRAVADSKPDHLGRRAMKEAHLSEIGIFRDDRESVLASKGPDPLIVRRREADVPNMGYSGDHLH